VGTLGTSVWRRGRGHAASSVASKMIQTQRMPGR
jgi:hypothetical protein